jgi:organic hydroperoxide reductase OsmC/OhrA
MSAGRRHSYSVSVRWTGNRGAGTRSYTAYERSHDILADGKPAIAGSSDPAFRGDRTRYNPEDLLVASLSACHMLAYLHECANAKIVVLEYHDDASGIMEETANGGGRFTEVVLRPSVVVEDPNHIEQASALHHHAHELCFIASSVNFPVRCEPATSGSSRD